MSCKSFVNNNRGNNRGVNNRGVNNNCYCKVCHDAGLPESVYKSHFVRKTIDKNSEVVCPTLLALKCKYCNGSGHTQNYCEVFKNRNTRQHTQISKNPIKYNNEPVKKNIVYVNKMEEFPSLSSHIIANNNNNISYKSIIILTQEQVLKEEERQLKHEYQKNENIKKNLKEEENKQLRLTNSHIPIPSFSYKYDKNKHWADYDDDEDKDDYEYVDNKNVNNLDTFSDFEEEVDEN